MQLRLINIIHKTRTIRLEAITKKNVQYGKFPQLKKFQTRLKIG